MALVQRILSSSEPVALFSDTLVGESEGLLRAYFAGAKRLWAEVAIYRRMRKRDAAELSWREMQIRSGLPGHVTRMLPLLVNPLPPPFGLILIAVASAAPRYLLTKQFWTLDQCRRFAQDDSLKLRRKYADVLASCSEALFEGARSIALANPATPLSALVDLFQNAPLSLESLKRRHLVRLCKSQRLFPAWLLPIVRTPRLRRALAQRAAKVDMDDDALSIDFLNLQPRHLFDACASRGLNIDGDDHARARRLRAWLDARDAVLHANGGKPLPPSFVLHMPAIFAQYLDQADL